MIRTRALGFVGMLLVALAGCSTTQVAPRQAAPIPAERVLWRPAQGDANITVVRDAGLHGGGCYFLLSLNRKPVARVDVAERIDLPVPAGDLLLSVARDPEGRGLCGLPVEHVVQREFAIRAGETKRFRIAVGGGGMDIMRSDF
jgi:hypothetical protein